MANKADRVAAQRAAAERTAATDAVKTGADARRNEIEVLARQVRNLIPEALRSLERRGFPDLLQRQVFLPRTGMSKIVSSKDRLAKVGAYAVSPYDFDEPSRRRPVVRWVLLLSNGRLAVGTGSHSAAEFEAMVLEREGLAKPGAWGHDEPFSVSGLRDLVTGLTALRDAA